MRGSREPEASGDDRTLASRAGARGTPAPLPAAVAGTLVALALTILPIDPLVRRTVGQEPEPTPREHGPHDATSRHPFNEIKKWVRVFDDPGRADWQRPEAIADALDLRPGMTVADLGAGTGYFLSYLSGPVSPGGLVLAIDTEPEMVKHMAARVGKDGLENVVPVLAMSDNPFLPRGVVDRVLIVDTYHHIDDRLNYFGRMKEVLTPGGTVAIVDFKKKPLPVGPPLEHKLAREFVIGEMRDAGWSLEREETFLPHQYFLIFRPREAASE